jgi:hypothetical protein
LNLSFQNVRLQREEQSLLQQLRWNLVGYCVCGFDEHLIGDAGRYCGEHGHPDCGENIEIVRLSGQERSSVETNRRELDAGRIDRLPLRPGVGLLGRAFGMIGRVRKSENHGPIIDSRHALNHLLSKVPPTVLTPIIVVGFMLSMAATKSRVGACLYGFWKSSNDCDMFTWSIGVDRCLVAQRRTCELAATIGDHLVHIHVELGAASRHPYVQREHVFMPAGQDLVTNVYDQPLLAIVKSLAGVIRRGRGFFQCRLRRDHFPRNQVLADTEVLERAPCLSAPQFIAGNSNFAEAICLRSKVLYFDFVDCFDAHNTCLPGQLLGTPPCHKAAPKLGWPLRSPGITLPSGVFCEETLDNIDL